MFCRPTEGRGYYFPDQYNYPIEVVASRMNSGQKALMYMDSERAIGHLVNVKTIVRKIITKPNGFSINRYKLNVMMGNGFQNVKLSTKNLFYILKWEKDIWPVFSCFL
ncbi:MAG: hypothetical protein LBQ60_05900 [Bacteroidales bacterium]|jgi:hypothetical protein|nr:hypothetical protein [Bacteroidales bacterium]